MMMRSDPGQPLLVSNTLATTERIGPVGNWRHGGLGQSVGGDVTAALSNISTTDWVIIGAATLGGLLLLGGLGYGGYRAHKASGSTGQFLEHVGLIAAIGVAGYYWYQWEFNTTAA